MKFNTLLFDLDGTLVDSAPDLASSLNSVLAKYNKKSKKFVDIRALVSKGAKELIKFGFNIDEKNKKFNYYHQELLTIYENNIAKNSQLFAGANDIINLLDNWGIVTNKSTKLTKLLLKKLKLKPDILVCGDTLNVNKPNPKPILYAIEKLNINSKNCAFIGDDIIDIKAGNDAKITTIAVSYGYSKPNKNWHYDYVINHLIELKKIIK